MSTFLSAEEAPLEVTTSGFRVEMVDAAGRVIVRQERAQPLRWKRWGTHALTFGVEIVREGQPTPYGAAVSVAIDEARSQLRTPGSLVARAAAKVTISAPETIETPDGQAAFAGWRGTIGSERPEHSFSLTEDTDLTARYWLRKAQ